MPRGRRKGSGRGRAGNVLQSEELIGWALGGLEREIVETRARLEALTAQAAQLRARAGRRGPFPAAGATAEGPAPSRRRRRGMSAAGRKRISDMMKKRWAEAKKKNRNRL